MAGYKHKFRPTYSVSFNQPLRNPLNLPGWYPDCFPIHFTDSSWVRLHLFPSEPLLLVGLNSRVVYANVNSNVVLQSEGLPEYSEVDIWEIFTKTSKTGTNREYPPSLVFKVDPEAEYIPLAHRERFRLGLPFDRWLYLHGDCLKETHCSFRSRWGIDPNKGRPASQWSGNHRPIEIFGSTPKDLQSKVWLERHAENRHKGRFWFRVPNFRDSISLGNSIAADSDSDLASLTSSKLNASSQTERVSGRVDPYALSEDNSSHSSERHWDLFDSVVSLSGHQNSQEDPTEGQGKATSLGLGDSSVQEELREGLAIDRVAREVRALASICQGTNSLGPRSDQVTCQTSRENITGTDSPKEELVKEWLAKQQFEAHFGIDSLGDRKVASQSEPTPSEAEGTAAADHHCEGLEKLGPLYQDYQEAYQKLIEKIGRDVESVYQLKKLSIALALLYLSR